MTVDAIKTAIEQLPEQARRKLADWLEELEAREWDGEIERDFSPGGRGQQVLEKVNQEIDRHHHTPLDEGLRSRQKRQ